jgi:hypothetical protein
MPGEMSEDKIAEIRRFDPDPFGVHKDFMLGRRMFSTEFANMCNKPIHIPLRMDHLHGHGSVRVRFAVNHRLARPGRYRVEAVLLQYMKELDRHTFPVYEMAEGESRTNRYTWESTGGPDRDRLPPGVYAVQIEWRNEKTGRLAAEEGYFTRID